MTTSTHSRHRLDDAAQLVIMLAVAGMAGAASFRHVHDWTMHNSPDGTGDWFGWANAMVTELIPLAAGLDARRRHRLHGKVGAYPIVLILGAVALSLTGQFAEATPSLSGWIISAIPAVGFLALVKLVLSRPTRPVVDETPAPVIDSTTDEPSPATEPERLPVRVPATIPTHLLGGARFAATQHQHTTGRPITPDELALRMSVSPDIAADLLVEIGHPVNGATVLSGEPQ